MNGPMDSGIATSALVTDGKSPENKMTVEYILNSDFIIFYFDLPCFWHTILESYIPIGGDSCWTYPLTFGGYSM